jgi:hypothetical protein
MNTEFGGTITYSLVNSGDTDAIVDILAEMVDTAGHSTTDSSSSFLVSAGSSSDFEHVLQLSASYDRPDNITVTVRLTITGALSFSDSTFCTFTVNQAAAGPSSYRGLSITVVIFCWHICLISESMGHHDSEIMDDRSID